MNYQKTLNLPKTEFSMRAELAQKEPQWLALWETNQLHAAIREARAGCEPYVLHDGPPYANGNIHIGHALNKILKDIIVKMKTMQGYDALYVPGWDCHGLPIEHQLFKELKKRKSDVDTVDFRRKAHDYAMKYVDIQREQFQRLGVLGQWEKPYLTLSPEYEYWILSSFSSLVKDGYVYRGLKPVNWCPNCETALAEAEVEYEDHNSPSVYVKFQVNNPQALGRTPKGKPLSLMIWTTTPWTLLANVAVAVHRAFQYVCVDIGEEAVVLEKTLCERVLGKAGVAKYEVLQEVSGEALQELLYTHPFGLKQNCRVVVVDYVTKEDGTGLVHTAPGHGQEDYEIGLKYHLDILMPVDDQGLFTQEAGAFAGQHVFKANEQIIQNLKARGMLAASETISHSYPHCWRCKKPIIFRATHQWFMKIDHKDLRAKLRQAVQEKILWIPASGQERMTGMIISRPDWCLSRQRHWGVPIPALECEGCGGEHKLYPAVIDHFASIVRTEGTDAWFRKGLPELLPEGFACPDCGKRAFKRTFDILDVWFDSGVSHKAVVGPMLGRKIPVDLYLEGSDQHRGWFQSSLIPAVALDGMPPYKAVLTHGFVMDGQGRKMSKSLGNVISPQDVIKTNGADILRLWVASSNYHDDIRLSKEIMARVIDAYRKIRNTIRFLLGNLDGFDPLKELLGYDHLVEIDQWALHKLQQVALDLREAYEQFEFARAYKLIYSYCNEALSGFYLDILKDRLYTSHAFSR
ncbi:MAG TPA: isoleucine--tRNA ligase, partial [Candidatus Omnitrophota bacterium]|nr:isoleucine--tRNA ligase [Candidatus Omnitrophota bacterium]